MVRYVKVPYYALTANQRRTVRSRGNRFRRRSYRRYYRRSKTRQSWGYYRPTRFANRRRYTSRNSQPMRPTYKFNRSRRFR